MNLGKRALIVVDVQKGFDDNSYWGNRNNPDCETNISALISAWRESKEPIVFVRHDSESPQSPLRQGQDGNDFKACISGEPDLLVTKSVNSAFYGAPNLEMWLRDQSIEAIAICGITTNHCCETTARMAGNLGFDTWFVIDAMHTFDRMDSNGQSVTADEISRMSALNLDGEFAQVIHTYEAIRKLTLG